MLPRMHHNHLVPARLGDLRPTQVTIGYLEVAEKRKEWAKLSRKKRDLLLERHVFPCVIGPKGQHYIVDHHHLGMALLGEAVETVWLTVLEDMSWVAPGPFWRTMEFHGWAHPYDASGQRCDYQAIPKQLSDLQDDPYRSLAGLVRRAGGYSKDTTPFAEFLWADHFRPRLKVSLIQAHSRRALREALALARDPEARYLPGWTGSVPEVKKNRSKEQ